jgi:hypothetical protein
MLRDVCDLGCRRKKKGGRVEEGVCFGRDMNSRHGLPVKTLVGDDRRGREGVPSGG